MARFGQLYLNKGEWQGKQVLSSEWVEQSTSAIYPLAWQGGHAHSYGYLWWVGSFKAAEGKSVDAYWAGGNGGQYIVVMPELDMVVVFTGSNYNQYKTMSKSLSLIGQYILPALKQSGA